MGAPPLPASGSASSPANAAALLEPFSAICDKLPEGTRLLAFRGVEGLSSLYRFELVLSIEHEALNMAAAIGAPASLAIQREGRPPLLVHGILASLEVVGELLRGAIYRAVLVPRLHRLTLTHHSRVFVDQSLPQILEAVLADGGFVKGTDFDFKLASPYPPYEHICQYRESSFAFLSRRMEREGVYYFFEQTEDKERLIITDDRCFHNAMPAEPVRWVAVGGAAANAGNGLRQFTSRHDAIPGRVRVHDYDYLRPTLDLSGEAMAAGGTQEIFLHAENAATPEDSQRLARLRAEELLCRQVVFRGAGRGPIFLRSGYTFNVVDHPRFDGRYLAVELGHRGKQAGLSPDVAEIVGEDPKSGDDVTYHFEVVAIPAATQHRPQRRTPVPRIYGLEKAIVDGSENHHYAQIDEHGRYLVKIMFDESALKDGKASTRIRMMQPHAGNPESFHFPLRKGTEVLLSFDGGDPDLPVIAGVMPNLHKPTRVTEANYTKNVLQTGGLNRIQIEDLDGMQHVRISSPIHDSFIHIGAPNDSHNNVSFTTGNSLSATAQDAETDVGHTRLTVIGGFFYKKGQKEDVVTLPIKGSGKNAVISPNGTLVKVEDKQSAVLEKDNTGGDPVLEEARAISASSVDSTDDKPPMFTTPPDLRLSPPSMFRDPDGRSSYRVGSDLKYVKGDNVTKLEGDDIKLVLGNELKHVHGHSKVNIDSGQVSTVVPTHTTIDILKTALYVSSFSFGVTDIKMTVFSSSQSLFYIKNHGFELTKVIMKIIH